MSRIFRNCILAFSLMLSALPATAKAASGPVIVELFTCIFCHTCTDANKFIGKYDQNPDVIALSLHVDYWAYLGADASIDDPLAERVNTARQKTYASAHNQPSLYTPQLVIGGQMINDQTPEANDMDVAEIFAKYGTMIEQKAAMSARYSADIALRNDGRAIFADVSGTLPSDGSGAVIYFVFFQRKHVVQFPEDDVRYGNSQTFYNSVREIRAIGTWNGSPTSVKMPLAEVAKSRADDCAILIQTDNNGLPGEIIGASRCKL